VVSTTDPYGRILGILDSSQSAVYSLVGVNILCIIYSCTNDNNSL
jgi:hypothetical protein